MTKLLIIVSLLSPISALSYQDNVDNCNDFKIKSGETIQGCMVWGTRNVNCVESCTQYNDWLECTQKTRTCTSESYCVQDDTSSNGNTK